MMWAATRFSAVWAGLAGGALASALFFGVGYLATASGASPARALVLTGSLIVGLATSGFVAGRLAPHSGRFHGSLAALALASVVVVVARLSGSPAPTGQVLLLALMAITVGGVTGWLSNRRR